MSMEVVVEYVLIENMIINYFIMSCCGAMFKVKPRWWIISCAFGSVMALFFPIFDFPVYIKIIATMLVAIIMVAISFPVKSFKDFAFYGFGFVFLTFVFGGLCQLLTSWFGELSTFLICIACMVLYICAKCFLLKLSRKRTLQTFTCSVQITCKGKKVEEIGYIDSANVLYDPLTSAPIVLITKEVFAKIVGEDYLFYAARPEKVKRLPYGHYVNAGGAINGGKMLVFMADKIVIAEKGKVREYNHTLLGISGADFSKTLNSGVLVHSALA